MALTKKQRQLRLNALAELLWELPIEELNDMYCGLSKSELIHDLLETADEADEHLRDLMEDAQERLKQIRSQPGDLT